MGCAWHLLADQDVDLSKTRCSTILSLFLAKDQTSSGEGNSIGWTRDQEMIPKCLWGCSSWRREGSGEIFLRPFNIKGELQERWGQTGPVVIGQGVMI